MKEMSTSAVLDALGDLHFRGGAIGKLAYTEFWASVRDPSYVIAHPDALLKLQESGLLGAKEVKIAQALRLALACP